MKNFYIRTNLVNWCEKIVHSVSNTEMGGFTEVNGEEQFVQVCNTLDQKEFVTTLLHELVHVMQNEQGMIDETEREQQAYDLEGILYNNYCASEGTVH